MRRKWKSVAALGMAVLLGCLMPTNTMLAAEEDTETVQEMEADSVSDSDKVSDDEAVSDDNESVDEAENADAENTGDEENAGDEADADDGNVDDEADAEDENVVDEANTDMDGSANVSVMSVSESPEAGGVEAQASTAAPVINITLDGVSCIDDWDNNNINYKYINNPSPKLAFSASLDNEQIMVSYYLDKNPGDKAKAKDEIRWPDKGSPMEWTLSSEDSYVVYVKAGEDENTVYARSCGIVVDTEAPKVTGVTDGGTCPEGTVFHVEDSYLESVTVNGKSVALASDGNYQVTLDGTLCEIKAKDKAGNETVCKVNVSGGRELESGGVVTVNGTYALKAGVLYTLSAGKWQIANDSTIYQGGSTFYVMTSDNYKFTKR